MQVRKLLLLCFAVISSLGFSQFQFNEYSCANINTVLDPKGVGNQQRPNWIELINNSTTVQTLTGWSIGTDRNGNNNKFPIPYVGNNLCMYIVCYSRYWGKSKEL